MKISHDRETSQVLFTIITAHDMNGHVHEKRPNFLFILADDLVSLLAAQLKNLTC
jgi:hypothetical protein